MYTVIFYCVALICVKPFLPFCKQIKRQCLKAKQMYVQMNSQQTNCTWKRNQVMLSQDLWDNNLKRQQKNHVSYKIYRTLLSMSSENHICFLVSVMKEQILEQVVKVYNVGPRRRAFCSSDHPVTSLIRN